MSPILYKLFKQLILIFYKAIGMVNVLRTSQKVLGLKP
jgi:hypothetical protein